MRVVSQKSGLLHRFPSPITHTQTYVHIHTHPPVRRGGGGRHLPLGGPLDVARPQVGGALQTVHIYDLGEVRGQR